MPETKEQIRRDLYQFLAVDKSVAKQIKTYLLRHDAAESIKETRKENNTLKMELVDKLQKARSKANQGIAAKHPNSASFQHQLIAIEWLLKWIMEWKYKSEQ